MMTSIEHENLVNDIRENGLLEPIILLEGKILDGRNRYTACLQLGIEPKTVDFRDKFGPNIDPYDVVISENFNRRHLNTAQKCQLALKALDIEEKRAKERMIKGKKNNLSNSECLGSTYNQACNNGRAIDIVAKKFGISPNSLLQAKKINEASKQDQSITDAWKDAQNGKIPLKQVVSMIQNKPLSNIDESVKKSFVYIGEKVLSKITVNEFEKCNETTKNDCIKIMIQAYEHIKKQLTTINKLPKSER